MWVIQNSEEISVVHQVELSWVAAYSQSDVHFEYLWIISFGG